MRQFLRPTGYDSDRTTWPSPAAVRAPTSLPAGWGAEPGHTAVNVAKPGLTTCSPPTATTRTPGLRPLAGATTINMVASETAKQAPNVRPITRPPIAVLPVPAYAPTRVKSNESGPLIPETRGSAYARLERMAARPRPTPR